MSAYAALASPQGIPCAMQHFLRQIDPKAPNHILSQGECQIAFQHWVAYIRGGDCGHPSDVTAKEHLRCPLLGCRESLDNLAATLQHVSECPWLSNAWYWCMYCCRPESFIASQEPYADTDTVQHKVQRKGSKLKRAVTFFKHLGLKSCSRNKNPGSSLAFDTESFDTSLAKPRRSEMEDTSHEISTCAELANSSCDARDRVSNPRIQTKTIYEMESSMTQTPHDLEYSSPQKQANIASQPCELDVRPPAMRLHSSSEVTSAAKPFTAIGAQFEGVPHDVEQSAEMLVSPASIMGPPCNRRYAEPSTLPYAGIGLARPANNGPHTVSLPEVVNRHLCDDNVAPPLRGSPLPSGNDGDLRDDANLSAQSQVEGLRETVRVLNEEWLRRCQSAPNLLLRASAYSLQFLLETGAQTLQLIFRGVRPSTFDAVFALAHTACAAACIMHVDDGSHCWNEFFQQILALENLIQNRSDAQLFVRLINLLWLPQCSSSKRLCGNYFLDEITGTLVPLRRPVGDLNGLPPTAITGLQAKPDPMTCLNSLKDGAVLQECSRFLDGVEYASVLERSKKNPTHLPWYAQNHVTNIEEMLRTIIHPLQHCDGIEVLHDTIKSTAVELSGGSLRSVREVEASLISNGKSSCLSPKVYKRYLHTVTSICDEAMYKAGPNWRDRYYATDLDMVLASLVEIDNRQRFDHIVARHQHYTNAKAMPGDMQTWPESTRTPSSSQSQTLIGSSLSIITSPTFTGGYSPATQPSSTTSPGSSFSAPTPSSSSSTEVTRCPQCPALFTGSARNRNTNLRRHIRNTRDHGNEVGYLCSVSGCGKILSRTDNLGKHVRTVHGGDTGAVLRRAGARKRRRYAEDGE